MNERELFGRRLRIGTRGSDLAMWQSEHIRGLLRAHWGERLLVELEVVQTQGDQIQDRPLHEVGGKGLFVKAIEARLLDGSVDLAVHSMKDMPAVGPDGLVVACTPPREDPRDALVGPAGSTLSLAGLAPGARVGTGSLRRGALLRRANPSVEVVPIRGNVPTRVGKVDAGEVDAVILAAAGLRRLSMADRIAELLPVDGFVPAPAQGILALQCRTDDARTRALLEPLSDPQTAVRTAAERGFVVRLGASCTVPLGCHAELSGDTVRARGVVVDPDGEPFFTATVSGPAAEARSLGRTLAETLLDQGAGEVVRRFGSG